MRDRRVGPPGRGEWVGAPGPGGVAEVVSALRVGLAAVSCATALSCTAAPGLSAVDRGAIEAAFARGDTDGDGKLSRAEAQRFPEIAARFDELDVDRDGSLSLAEFAAGAAPPGVPRP